MKLNLLKKLLTLSPVVISPILVTACGSSNNGGKTAINNDTVPGKFYLDFYQRELNAVWATKTADINAAADDVAANHQYDLGINLVDGILPKMKADGAAEFKREFPTLDNYDADIFDDITVSFSIPDDSKGNLKLADNGVLSIYPASIISGQVSEKHIDYTLKLTSSKVAAKDLSGSLKFNLQAGFVNYDTGSGLISNDVRTVYGNADMSTILVGADKGGLDVGTRAKASDPYTFKNYSTSSAGSKKIASDVVISVCGNANMSEILVGEIGGGLDVGTKQADGSYAFQNYKTGQGLANNSVASVFGNADLSTIFLGEQGGGLDIGSKQGDGSYTFVNYDTSSASPLADDVVGSVYGNADLSTIFLGEQGGGLDIGSKQGDGSYNFTNYNTAKGLASNNVYDVFGSSNMATILVGNYDKGLDVGTKQADESYTFVNYNKDSVGSGTLGSDYIESIYGSADLSTILVGEGGGGLDVGTRAKASDPYTFTNYNTSSDSKLSSDNIGSVYGTADLSTILIGTYVGGMDISSNLWFA